MVYWLMLHWFTGDCASVYGEMVMRLRLGDRVRLVQENGLRSSALGTVRGIRGDYTEVFVQWDDADTVWHSPDLIKFTGDSVVKKCV